MKLPRGILSVLIAVGALLAHRTALAQHVIDTPEGRVEVIGMKRWTPAMLADSLGLHAPGVSLFQTHECTKAMTSRLHFRSVYIDKTLRIGQGGERAQSIVIRLVEPQDSARIRWRREPRDSQAERSEWSDLLRVLSDSGGAFVEGRLVNSLGLYGVFLRDGSAAAAQKAAEMGLDSARTASVWMALGRHGMEADRVHAIQTLGGDGSRRSRMMAAAILANFPDSDEAWRALAEALRDPYPGVNVAAIQSLTLLGWGFARPVDWAPAASSLRAVLDGTNLQAFLPLVQVLSRTSIAPALARPLLRGGGELVLAHARAVDRPSRDAAEALLRRLSGQAAPRTDWRAWVAGL